MVRGENAEELLLEKSKNLEENSVEKEVARKCEGQLSSLVQANSCSSCKDTERTSEMAQDDNSPCWDSLPSVILLEIFSYLPQFNRLRASQVYNLIINQFLFFSLVTNFLSRSISLSFCKHKLV